jgi:hypothetical protein
MVLGVTMEKLSTNWNLYQERRQANVELSDRRENNQR